MNKFLKVLLISYAISFILFILFVFIYVSFVIPQDLDTACSVPPRLQHFNLSLLDNITIDGNISVALCPQFIPQCKNVTVKL